MKLTMKDRGFAIEDLTSDDVKSLKRMIKSACLNERRDFDNLKDQIEAFEKQALLAK